MRWSVVSRLGGRRALVLPVVAFFAVLLLWPLVELLQAAIAGGGTSLDKLHSNPTTGMIVKNTLVISAYTVVVVVVLGYFLAFCAWRMRGWQRLLIIAFVLLPFWTGVLVKNFAWTIILQEHGLVNSVLQSLHITDHPLSLLHNRFAVIVGMAHYCLPYAFFPIFAVMVPLDPRIERAAESLGAGRWRLARHIILPLTAPGVLAAALLTFIIAAGFFITPVILGGPGDRMVANMIDYYQTQVVDLNTASMLAMLVTAVFSVLVLLYNRVPKEGQYGNL
ncbi:MAG: ABC transporter permease [Solirubrobacteraceae bacterium]